MELNPTKYEPITNKSMDTNEEHMKQSAGFHKVPSNKKIHYEDSS